MDKKMAKEIGTEVSKRIYDKYSKSGDLVVHRISDALIQMIPAALERRGLVEPDWVGECQDPWHEDDSQDPCPTCGMEV